MIKFIETLKENLLNKMEEREFTPDEIFDGMIDPKVLASAKEKFKDLEKNQEGQKKIIDLARHGDPEAVTYLYNRYILIFKKDFWKYYIGPNREYAKPKIYNGNATELASIALSMLSGQNDPNPYEKFDFDKINLTPKTDLIACLGTRISQYYQNECVKLAAKQAKRGITGNLKQGETVTVDSYDIYADNLKNEGASEDDTAVRDFNIIFDDFENYLGTIDPKLSEIFNMRRKQYEFDYIAEKLDLSENETKNLWNKVKNLFVKRYPDLKNAY